MVEHSLRGAKGARVSLVGFLWMFVAAVLVAEPPGHKLIAPRGVLEGRPGVELWHDYGAFGLYLASEAVFPALPPRVRSRVRSGPELDRLLVGSLTYDPVEEAPRFPYDLGAEVGRGPALGLVQFVGPAKARWLEALRALGAEPVHPIAHHGYLVWVGDEARTALSSLVADGDWLRYSGAYPPYLKIDPRLRTRVEGLARGTREGDERFQVVIQRFRGADRSSLDERLRELSVRRLSTWAPVLRYENLYAEMRLTDVAVLARRDDVVWVGLHTSPRLFDELQGQILAGDLTTDQSGPLAPGYLSFLDSLGFSADPADYPIVDIVDDGLGNGSPQNGDSTLHLLGDIAAASRVAYVNNCTLLSSAGSQGGHGHLNASIVAGYDDRFDFPFEDLGGYRRGLGTNPYGRLAATKIFDPFLISLVGCGGTYGSLIETLQNSGATIASNSWGNPLNANLYDESSQIYDAATRDADPSEPGHQPMTFVFAPGNGGPDPMTVGSPGNAKNVITVGASESFRPVDEDGAWTDGCMIGPEGADHAMDIIDFSSRGPAPGGRVKPDLVAPGTHVQGTASTDPTYTGSAVCDPFKPSGQTLFAASSGTSHSTPAVAGIASLLVHWLSRVEGLGQEPSPAMLKAHLAAHATYLSGEGAGDTLPSHAQGYGMPDLGRMFDATPRVLVDQSHNFDGPGETWVWSGGVADPAQPLRIVLAYTDAPGLVGTAPQVNDLSLEVAVGGQSYHGNVFSGSASVPGGVADTANNIEAVFLPAGVSGALEITLTAANVAGDGVPGVGDDTDQDFALVCYNCAAEPAFTLEVRPPRVHACRGDDAMLTVDVGSIFGFADPVSLGVTGHPAGTSAIFDVNPVVPAGQSELTVSGTSNAALGDYVLEVTGSSGARLVTRAADLVLHGAPPPVSALLEPADGAILQPLLPTFTWQPSADAASYRFELARDPGFGELVAAASGLSEASLTLAEPLERNTRYYWRARPENPCGEAPWPAPRSFVTEPLPGECSLGTTPVELFADDLESSAPGWSSEGVQDTWMLSSARANSGLWSFHAEDVPSISDQRLVSPEISLPFGEPPLSLSFFTYQAIESRTIGGCWDGGVVELSTDGGTSWQRLEPENDSDPYDGAIASGFGNPLEGEDAWCGDPQDWLEARVDLSPFAGQFVRLRFRLATDGVGGREGWYIDDLRLQSCAPPPEPPLFIDGFESGDTSAWSRSVP